MITNLQEVPVPTDNGNVPVPTCFLGVKNRKKSLGKLGHDTSSERNAITEEL